MSTGSKLVSTKLFQFLEKRGRTTRRPTRITMKLQGNSKAPETICFDARRPLPKLYRTLDAVSRGLYSLPHLLHNLVNALARKVKFICDKTQRFSAAMEFKNLRVSIKIRLGSWAQRAPLPSRNLFKFLHAFAAQLSLSTALSKITNPRTKRKRGAVHVLDVCRGNSTMSFSSGELVDGCNGEIETRDVVHVENNNIKFNIN